MNHIMRFESYSSQERLDDILDKISKYGEKNLTDLELKFLGSFSSGKQESIHDEIKFIENEVLFEDDHGNFKFEFKSYKETKNVQVFVGTIYVPDMDINGSIIHGCMSGKIIRYANGNISLDFKNGEYDIFEFCSGIECELDQFVDYIISEIEQKRIS